MDLVVDSISTELSPIMLIWALAAPQIFGLQFIRPELMCIGFGEKSMHETSLETCTDMRLGIF